MMKVSSCGIGSIVVLLGLLVMQPAPTSAQQQRERVRERAPRVRVDGAIAPQMLLRNMRLPRARIGVALGGEEQADHTDGAYVQDVTEDGPADRAGIREGDVIVAIDGHRLTEPLDAEDEEELDEDGQLPVQRLMALAGNWEPGDAVEVIYLRDGRESTVTMETEESEFSGALALRLGELGDRMSVIGPRLREQLAPLGENDFRFDSNMSPRVWIGEGGDSPSFAFAFGAVGGLELRALNPELGRYFGTEEGVLVLDVDEESTLGLQAGDVILAIGDRDVDDAGDVRRILRSYDASEQVRLQIMRDGQRSTVEGTIRD